MSLDQCGLNHFLTENRKQSLTPFQGNAYLFMKSENKRKEIKTTFTIITCDTLWKKNPLGSISTLKNSSGWPCWERLYPETYKSEVSFKTFQVENLWKAKEPLRNLYFFPKSVVWTLILSKNNHVG